MVYLFFWTVYFVFRLVHIGDGEIGIFEIYMVLKNDLGLPIVRQIFSLVPNKGDVRYIKYHLLTRRILQTSKNLSKHPEGITFLGAVIIYKQMLLFETLIASKGRDSPIRICE